MRRVRRVRVMENDELLRYFCLRRLLSMMDYMMLLNLRYLFVEDMVKAFGKEKLCHENQMHRTRKDKIAITAGSQPRKNVT